VKKLINDPRHVVREMLEGLVDTTAHLALIDNENIVVPRDLPKPAERIVAVISGGGSGHEPAHAGYVGPGLLSAAVAGDVFTSPSVDAVLTAIVATAGPAGALLVVKNYTGDRLNFGLAAELARERGIAVEIVVVADDVSLQGTVPIDRRRGIAGTVLVHKVAGAAAAQGLPLADVAGLARRAAARLGSMGIGLSACTANGWRAELCTGRSRNRIRAGHPWRERRATRPRTSCRSDRGRTDRTYFGGLQRARYRHQKGGGPAR